jgi:hypothetical protein
MADARLHLIAPEETLRWSQLLRDRRLTSHTYNATVADEILERRSRSYFPCSRASLARLRTSPESRSRCLYEMR